MSETEESYGTYHTKLSTIKHSALPNWSGYGYQGHCAMHHAIKLLCDNKVSYKDFYLSLESFEDFAIMDSSDNIYSLHQCKCYASGADFTDECHKISDKREYYCKVLKNCTETVPCYFHSNITPTKVLVCNVIAYEFLPGNTTCSPVDIIKLIEQVVRDYMLKYGCSGSENAKACVLMSMIQTKVAEIHKKKQATADDYWQIALQKDNWIPFSEIIAKLEESDSIIISEALRALAARNSINAYLTRCLNEDINDEDYPIKVDLVEKFLGSLNSINNDDLIRVIRRINPHVEWDETCVIQLQSPEKGNNLYKLLTNTKELSDFETFSWNEDGILETPSTLGRDRRSIRHAEAIRKSSSLAFLRDYRWIVGDVDSPIDDIYDKAPSMVDVEVPQDYERITRPSRLGLLSIDAKNDSDYEKDHS